MRFGFWPMPGTPWAEALALSRHAEAIGFDGIWYADHFMPMEGDLSKPINESWTALAALAASVPRVRLGHLVNGNTYRNPAILAKMAAGIDIISDGRFVLGMGAGWQQNEHALYGIHFGTLGERLRRLEEALSVIRQLLRTDAANLDGKFYQIQDAPLFPKPVQERLPIMIGAAGEKVALRIVAEYADEWNAWGLPDLINHKSRVLDTHCNRIRRDPASIRRTGVALVIMAKDQALRDSIAGNGRPPVHRLAGRNPGRHRRLRGKRRGRVHHARLAPRHQPGRKEGVHVPLHHGDRRPLPLTRPRGFVADPPLHPHGWRGGQGVRSSRSLPVPPLHPSQLPGPHAVGRPKSGSRQRRPLTV